MKPAIFPIQSAEQVYQVVDGAIADSMCAVVGPHGIFVCDKADAISAFMACARKFCEIMDDEVVIVSVSDTRGKPAIGFAVNSPAAAYLYGVPDQELMLHTADVGGTKQ